MTNYRIIERPAFEIIGRKTWISGPDNNLFRSRDGGLSPREQRTKRRQLLRVLVAYQAQRVNIPSQ